MIENWIDWKPANEITLPDLPDDAVVVVRYRDGLESRGRRVDTLRWSDTGESDDVVAYRIIGGNNAPNDALRALEEGDGSFIPPWSIKAYAGGKHPTAPPGVMVLHTWHTTDVSKDIEIEVFQTRMKRGEISRIEILDHANAKTETLWS